MTSFEHQYYAEYDAKQHSDGRMAALRGDDMQIDASPAWVKGYFDGIAAEDRRTFDNED